MDLTPVRGCRDFTPKDAIARARVTDVLRSVFQKYGYPPLETPALENFETLSSKFAGGEEILRETYCLKDQGGRDLGLRYDLTVPLCRVIASNPRLAMPFKRYQIQPVWRDGPIKAGRYREFTQCDVDVLGVESLKADAEIICLAQDAFEALELPAKMKVNNRKALNALLEKAGVPKEKEVQAILSIDKLGKIGFDGALKELIEERGLEEETARAALNSFKEFEGKNNEEKIALLEKKLGNCEGVKELKELLAFSNSFGVQDFVEIAPELARGLNYYTGTVFEVYALDNEIKSSLAAGGRYDDLVGAFAGRERVPAVGISFGLDVITAAKDFSVGESVAQCFVVPVKDCFDEAAGIADALRAEGVCTSIDLLDRGLGKNLEYAAKQGIPFAVIVGKKELKEGKVTLRNLKSGEEKLLEAKDAAKIILG